MLVQNVLANVYILTGCWTNEFKLYKFSNSYIAIAQQWVADPKLVNNWLVVDRINSISACMFYNFRFYVYSEVFLFFRLQHRFMTYFGHMMTKVVTYLC